MNTNLIGPSWAPKLGGILCIVGIGLKKHPSESFSFWSDILNAIGLLIMGWSARQNGVTSEQVAESKAKADQKFGLFCLLALCLAFQGCTAPILPGNDPVVVRAEQVRSIAADTFAAFVRLEHRDRPALQAISPSFTRIADQVRAQSDGWIQSLTRVLATYKLARTPNNRASLTSAISVLNASLQEVELHTAIAAQKGIQP